MEQAREFCATLTAEYDASHDVNHHDRVLEYVRKIVRTCEKTRVIEIAELAAMLHDTVDHKYPDADKKYELLKKFLQDTAPEIADQVLWVIDHMSYSKEVKNGRPIHSDPDVTAARNIVSDADKLEAMGYRGIIRCMEFTKNKYQVTTDELIKLVVEHCHEKLLRLKDEFIITDNGKELARPLHAELEHFVALWS